MSDLYRQHEWIMWRVGELFDEWHAIPKFRLLKQRALLRKINNMIDRAEMLRMALEADDE